MSRLTTAFTSVAPTKKHLWQVIQVYKLETYLNDRLWFSRLDQFGDEREGTLPDPNKAELDARLEYEREFILKEYEGLRNLCYAACFHDSDGDPSEAVWDTFSKTGPDDTIAVRTDFESLKNALLPIMGEDGPVHVRTIKYIKHADDYIPITNVLEAAFSVKLGYSEEEETRALLYLQGTAANVLRYNLEVKMEEGSDGSKGIGITVPIDPQKLIREVLYHKDMTSSAKEQIHAMLKAKGMEGKLRK